MLGLTLAYGLICGFLTGYDKLSGERSVDWGAVAGFTSAFATFVSIAAMLWIFSQWNRQKGSEVVANEAKHCIIQLSGLAEIQVEMLRSLEIHNDHRVDEKIFLEFKEIYRQITKSTRFLKSVLDDKALENDLSNLLSEIKKTINSINLYSDGRRSYDEINVIEVENVELLIDSLFKYSLYETSFKSSKK